MVSQKKESMEIKQDTYELLEELRDLTSPSFGTDTLINIALKNEIGRVKNVQNGI